MKKVNQIVLITLRPATAADAPMLAETIRTIFGAYEGALNPPSSAPNETAETVAAKIAKGGGLLAYVDEQFAGCVLFYPDDGRVYLGRLAVLPDYRKHGIGGALVHAVEGWARDAGFPAVILAVRIVLPKNRAFFEKHGYRVVEEKFHPGFDKPTFLLLEKPV